jgi:CheY-like chemotaxis protein
MKKKILIADDDSAILEAMTLMVGDEGYDVTSTADGQTMENVYKLKPDLVLLDIRMAGVDGRDICRQLKNQKSTKNIPIIMISANKDAEEIAKEAGADDFITKPFQMDDLLEKVAKFTGTH